MNQAVVWIYVIKIAKYIYLGWSWDPQDRPTFSEIHKWLNTVFSTTSVDEGILSIKDLLLIFFSHIMVIEHVRREVLLTSPHHKFPIPLHPNISMHILFIVLYISPKVLTWRICLTIRRFFYFVRDHFFYSCDLNVWLRGEKLDASHL